MLQRCAEGRGRGIVNDDFVLTGKVDIDGGNVATNDERGVDECDTSL